MSLHVVFDGWGSALVAGLLAALLAAFTLNTLQARRQYRLARRVGDQDLVRNLLWLTYRDWQQKNPNTAAYDTFHGGLTVEPLYLVALLDHDEDSAESLFLVHHWVAYMAHGPTSSWRGFDDGDRDAIRRAARDLNERFRFRWSDGFLAEVMARDFSAVRVGSAATLLSAVAKRAHRTSA